MVADSTASAGLRPLQNAVTMWAVGFDGSASSVLAAANALADGFDSPALREMAGLPLETSWWVSEDLVREAFAELDLDFPDASSPATKLVALRVMCQRFLEAEIGAEQLTEWAHSVIGHEFPDEQAEKFVLLDDTDDYLPERPADWAPRVRSAAEAFIARD